MMSSPEERRAVTQIDALERPLAALEHQLAALGLALHRQDMAAVDSAAEGLHSALSNAVDHFSRAARLGGAPLPLRQRLALASGQVAAQREALARATASLDRAMDVLLPRDSANSATSLYGALGHADSALRAAHPGGSLLA
jgi:multidrug resistance efflux pump